MSLVTSSGQVEPLRDRLSGLLIVLVVAMVATPIIFQGIMALLPGGYDHPAVLSISIVVQQGVLLLLALVRLRRLGASWSALRPYAERFRHITPGLGWGFILLFLNGVLAQLALAFFKYTLGTEAAMALLAREQQAMERLLNPESPFYLGLIVLLAVGLAPVVEEVFFRGYAYAVLKHHVGGHAIWLSGLLFAGVHMYVINFLPLFVLGMVLARLYERTGSLAVPIIAHATVNGMITILSVLLPTES